MPVVSLPAAAATRRFRVVLPVRVRAEEVPLLLPVRVQAEEVLLLLVLAGAAVAVAVPAEDTMAQGVVKDSL